jgi:hypothetical protein
MKAQKSEVAEVDPLVIPPPPPPTLASKEVDDAGQEQKRLNKRRFGFDKTTYAGAGGSSVLGGAAALGGARLAA